MDNSKQAPQPVETTATLTQQVKVCKRCGVTTPATREFFYKYSRKNETDEHCFLPNCKKCTLILQKEIRSEKYIRREALSTEEVQKRRAKDAIVRAKRKAAGKIKPAKRTILTQEQRQRSTENSRRWRRDNPEKEVLIRKVAKHKRRAREREAPGSFTSKEWTNKLSAYAGKCHWCEQDITGSPHADHVIPLSRGGSNSIDNIVPSCAKCNLSKSYKLPEEWRQENVDAN